MDTIGKQAGNSLTNKRESFDFQLKMLEKELDSIDKGLERTDKMIYALKNWSIVVWGASFGFSIEKGFDRFTIFTAILPLIFWYTESWWRFYTGVFTYRQRKISSFLNSDSLAEAFRTSSLGDFKVYDPVSKLDRDKKDFKEKVNLKRYFFSTEIAFMYAAEIIISLVAGLYFLLK